VLGEEEFNDFIDSLSPTQVDLPVQMLRRERMSAVHDVLVRLTWWIDCGEVALTYRAEPMPWMFLKTRMLKAPELQHVATTHIHDLCVLAIGATRDVAEIAMGRGLRAARLHALKAEILQSLSSDPISTSTLACAAA
jgi:hypothetical protein